jgi:hypothetical protein
MSAEDGRPRQVVLEVPELDGLPFGWGCCAVTRVDVLLEELDSWPGLLTLNVEPDSRTAVVLVNPGCEDLPAALDALADRGLPAEVVRSTSSDRQA